jgi:hypothetical protein
VENPFGMSYQAWADRWKMKRSTVFNHMAKGCCYIGTKGDSMHPLYQTYNGMISRCYSASDEVYSKYGAIGVRVCGRWFYSFKNFVKDVGQKPEGTYLDCVDKTRNFGPDNFSWVVGKLGPKHSKWEKMHRQKILKKKLAKSLAQKEAEKQKKRQAKASQNRLEKKNRALTLGKINDEKDHPLYATWQGMIRRCYYKSDKNYKNYGARGIDVCDRWRHSFQAFADDMIMRPDIRLTLDRIDNDKGYSPENCRWADWTVQAANRRNTVTNAQIQEIRARHAQQSIRSIARDMGISYGKVWSVAKDNSSQTV